MESEKDDRVLDDGSFQINRVAIEVGNPDISKEQLSVNQEEKSRKEGEAQKRLGLVIASLIMGKVLFARIISYFNREPYWNLDSPGLGSLIKDHRIILWYHPEFILNSSDALIAASLEAECIHIINKHHQRSFEILNKNTFAEARNAIDKNKKMAQSLAISADLVANFELKSVYGNKTPKDGQWPTATEFDAGQDNSAMDTIFIKLMEKGGNEDGNDAVKNATNSHSRWFEDNPENIEHSFNRAGCYIDAVLEKAIRDQEKHHGTVPAGFQRLLDRSKEKPEIPWYKLLANSLASTLSRVKISNYSRPVKAMLALYNSGYNVCLYPSKRRKHGYNIVMAVDTSGSMSHEDLSLAVNEIMTLLTQYPQSRLYLMWCDALIEKEILLDPSSYDFDTKLLEVRRAYGGGGTSFEPPFKRLRLDEFPMSEVFINSDVSNSRIEKYPQYNEINAFVYFTDGHCDSPDRTLMPKCPTFWVITRTGQDLAVRDLGHVIHMNN